VYAFKNTSGADKFFGIYQASEVATCIEKATAKVLRSRTGAGEPSVSPITNLEGVGDAAVGYEITIPISAQGQSATVYLDLIAARVGRAVVGFNFSNLDASIPEGPGIVQAVLGRVAEAQAPA
jgi:hypothetical protein